MLFRSLRGFAVGVWVLSAALLAVLGVAVGGHWLRHPHVARDHSAGQQMVHFYGAAPMALLTVASGAMPFGMKVMSSMPSTALACTAEGSRWSR